jgi:hypothetical protein
MGFMTTIRYGTWWDWLPDDEGGYPNQKVAFSAREKIIYVNEGVTELDVKIDIYSAWKEWNLSSPEEPFPIAFLDAISAIGGEPLNDTLNVGSTFFLENGWRIQPFASKTPYVLNVIGNIYTREAGENPFRFAEGVSVNLTRSNLVDQLVATSTITEADQAAIATKVWQVVSGASGNPTYGSLNEKQLKKGEFLALK